MSTIRTYRAATVREALALVRAEMGADALILGQREIRQRPFPWRKVKVETELTAASPSASFQQRLNNSDGQTSEATSSERSTTGPVPIDEPSSFSEQTPRTLATATQLFDTTSGSSLSRTARTSSAVPDDDPFLLYTRLIDRDVDEAVARRIVGEVQSPASDQITSFAGRCHAALVRSTPCRGPIRVTPGRRRIAALVGPTGVGKTTTIAKLAANFRLRDRVRVGLITVDTYRVAAVEQLRTYAELIGVPMKVVTTPREMPAALDELTDVDLVLIDTAGRSPGDDLRIQELRSYLQAAQADEVHLVASLTSGLSHLAVTVERFGRVSPTALLLTKLDEAAGPGAVVSAARLAELPLSYLTTGQNVPDDIETAEADRIARRVLPIGTDDPEPGPVGRPDHQRVEFGSLQPAARCGLLEGVT